MDTNYNLLRAPVLFFATASRVQAEERDKSLEFESEQRMDLRLGLEKFAGSAGLKFAQLQPAGATESFLRSTATCDSDL